MITAVIYLLVFLIVFPFLVVGVGVTIFVARQRYKKHAAALQAVLPTNAERPSQLHPVDLERLAVYVYQRLGYRNVTHTGAHSSTDGGVDVWMLSPSGHPEIVQCKQWQDVRVGKGELIEFAKIIRQQHAMLGHYWAPFGFTKGAIQYARDAGILLYNDYGIRITLEKAFDAEIAALNASPAVQPVAPTRPRPRFLPRMKREEWIVVIALAIMLVFLVCIGAAYAINRP